MSTTQTPPNSGNTNKTPKFSRLQSPGKSHRESEMFPKTPGLELESRITTLSQRGIYWSCSPNRNRRAWSTSSHQNRDLFVLPWQLLLQENQGATVPTGNGVWSRPGPAIVDFGDNYPPLELQTAPGGLQALSQEGQELSQVPEGDQRCWKLTCTFGKLLPSLSSPSTHREFRLEFRVFPSRAPLGPSPIPWDPLEPMECFGSSAHSMQGNLGVCLDGREGAGWINLGIRMERDCSWSPDPTANPQRWSWKSLGASGSCWDLRTPREGASTEMLIVIN